jgi:HSP20 family protein
MAQRGLTPYSQRGLFGGDPLQQFHREMDRLFDDVFRGALAPFGAGGQAGSVAGAWGGGLRLDVHETDDQLCVTADLPGVKQDELDVRIDGDVLTISGDRRNENENKQANWHVMERSYGNFARSVQLPFAPDPQKVQARFADGVLTVTMPSEGRTPRARRIEVRGADSPAPSGGQPGWSQGTSAPGAAQHGGGYAASGSTMMQGERGAGSLQQSAGGASTGAGSSQQAGASDPASASGQQSAGTARKGTLPGDLPG